MLAMELSFLIFCNIFKQNWTYHMVGSLIPSSTKGYRKKRITSANYLFKASKYGNGCDVFFYPLNHSHTDGKRDGLVILRKFLFFSCSQSGTKISFNMSSVIMQAVIFNNSTESLQRRKFNLICQMFCSHITRSKHQNPVSGFAIPSL